MPHSAFEPASVTVPGTTKPGLAVTCTSCGCRLERADDLNGYLHVAPRAGRDAAGCVVPCAEMLHDARGKSL